MASKVDIVNMALVKLGADTIMDLDEDTENARKAKAIYNLVRDEVLRAHPWNFAIEWAQLAQLNETPKNGFDYAYQLPTEPYCLKVVRLHDDYVTEPFRVEGRKLYCNLDSVIICYIKRVDDTSVYDTAFITAFANRLAAELAYSITGSSQTAQKFREEYIISIREARGLDSQEGTVDKIEEYSWINARSN